MLKIVSILGSLSYVQLITVSILPVLFAITVHEVAHGWAAKQLGDPTAERLGRLTLNPIKHIDPMGTLLVPLVLILTKANFLFGWAKPVPITWQNLRRPKLDMVLVALAGPGANLLMAIMWGLIVRIGELIFKFGIALGEPIMYMGLIGILINTLLMVFNMLPLPPLDGGRVAVGLLPGPWAWRLSRLEPYGLFIVVGLMFTGVLWKLILFPSELIISGISWFAGLR